MPEFSPKSDYQGFHADCSEELSKQHDKRWFTVSIAYALAQMTAANCTGEELSGARKFIQTLLNLPEKPGKLSGYPPRRLEALENPSTEL